MSTYRSYLTLFLATLATPLALTACGGTGTDADDTDVLVLDDVICTGVDLGAECPSDADAATLLIGHQTCESPVREVIAVGVFLYEEDAVPTGYGGYDPFTGDTGTEFEAVTRCCYEAAYKTIADMSCTPGRPLRVAGEPLAACAADRDDWNAAPAPDVRLLSPAAREALAASWTRAALMEHASVPAFARVILDLTAHGAPADLLARSATALADEVAHAEACFALASAYAGRPVGPDVLPIPGGRRPSLARLAVETFREGCVGESLAVALAAAQLREATDPAVRAVLARIVDDEARHAELAWDIVAWAVRVGGAKVRRAVQREADRLGSAAYDEVSVVGADAHGLADPARVREALDRALAEVVAPTARALLAA